MPLLVVLRFNFAFFWASPVLFVGKSLLNITGRGSFQEVKFISFVLLVAGACSSFSEVNVACKFLLTSAKRKNRAFVTALVLYHCFLLGFFIRVVFRNKFIGLGYSCLAVISSLL